MTSNATEELYHQACLRIGLRPGASVALVCQRPGCAAANTELNTYRNGKVVCTDRAACDARIAQFSND